MRRKRIRLTGDKLIERNKKVYQDWKDGMSITDLVIKYNVSQTQIYNIKNDVEAQPSVYDISR